MSTQQIQVLRHERGWAVVPIHYSMDAEKDLDWYEEMRKLYATDQEWELEQEISFSSISGARVYVNYSEERNTRGRLRYDPTLPLMLACDFNVDPMAWVILQYRQPILYAIDEIFLRPGSVEAACEEMLNSYGEHEGELIIFGDPAGHARQQKDGRSNFQTMQLLFMRRRFKVSLRAPAAHFGVVDSVASVNMLLKDPNGEARFIIDKQHCPQLCADLVETVWDDTNKKSIKKVSDPKHPYFVRTHAAEGVRNLIHRQFPTYKKLQAARAEQEIKAKAKSRRQPRRLVGTTGL